MTEVNKQHLDQVSAARYEAETFMSMHPEFFATPENGRLITEFMAEKNLKLNATNMEYSFEKLKAAGKLLPAGEEFANMTAAETKEFAKQHGEPVYDGFGNISGYNLPDVYRAPASSYNRPRQSSTIEPVADRFPQDAGKTFTPKQLASFSADRLKAFYQRTNQWGK